MSEGTFAPDQGLFEPGPDFLDQHPAIPVPQRNTIVPSWYNRHKKPRETWVTKDGKRIDPGFTVAHVAAELRWAIGEDGEVLEQHEFQEAHGLWYRDQYAFFRQPPDDPNLRNIPRVERFVARCVDPYDDSRLQPIQRAPATAKESVKPVYNASGELASEAGENEVPAGMTVKADTTDGQAESAPESKAFETPCGKPLSSSRYMSQHMRGCDNEDCATLTAEMFPKE